MIEEIAQAIFQWGPAGAIGVLIIVAEKKLRLRWDSARGKERKICVYLYIANWIFISTLMAVMSIVWIKDKNKTNATMSGIVQDLGPAYRINSSTEDFFTRIKRKNNFLRDVHWHYFKDKLPKQLDIRLETKNDFKDYAIPLTQVENVMNIHLLHRKDGLYLKTSTRPVKLKPIYSASDELQEINSKTSAHNLMLFKIAHAKENLDFPLILESLDSDDSYLRQYASQYLATNINYFVEDIDKQLRNYSNSNRITIGLISAVAKASIPKLQNKTSWELSSKTLQVIANYALSEDEVLAKQSKRFLVRNINTEITNFIHNNCDFKLSNKLRKTERCAYVLMNLNYNLAIKTWSQSKTKIEPLKVSIEKIKEAISILEKSTGLSQFAEEKQKVQFGKIYYGLAFLNHELTKLSTAVNDTIVTEEFEKKSLSYFKTFLTFTQDLNIDAYEYPHHLSQAECYLGKNKTPILKQLCFDIIKPNMTRTEMLPDSDL